jgi:hypothetical protein
MEPSKTRVAIAVAVFAGTVLGGCGGGTVLDASVSALEAGAMDQTAQGADSRANVLEVVAARDAEGWQLGVLGAELTDLLAMEIDGIDLLPMMRRAVGAGAGEFQRVDNGFYFVSSNQLEEDGVPAAGQIVIRTVAGTSDPLSIAFVKGDASEEEQLADFGRASISAAKKAACPEVNFTYPSANWANPNCLFASTTCGKDASWAHTGTDHPGKGAVLAFADGQVLRVVRMNATTDHGLGNTVVLGHVSGCEVFVSQSSHLSVIDPRMKPGAIVRAGMIVGQAGASGYGDLNYWTKWLGKDDTHLHWELKRTSVLGNPTGVGKKKGNCSSLSSGKDAGPDSCWGYVPARPGPAAYGYLDPAPYLKKINKSIVPY